MPDAVVYVDDEPALCRIFDLAVGRRVDAPVVTFVDPAEALAYINDNAVLLVLCDYRMPKMNGLQLLEGIDRDVPFFLVSGDLSLEDIVGDNPRVVGIIDKPTRPPRLVDLVQSYEASRTSKPDSVR